MESRVRFLWKLKWNDETMCVRARTCVARVWVSCAKLRATRRISDRPKSKKNKTKCEESFSVQCNTKDSYCLSFLAEFSGFSFTEIVKYELTDAFTTICKVVSSLCMSLLLCINSVVENGENHGSLCAADFPVFGVAHFSNVFLMAPKPSVCINICSGKWNETSKNGLCAIKI